MPSFTYKAKKPTAETVTGQIRAESYDEAVELIGQLGLLPVEVEEQSQRGETVSKIKSRPVTAKDLYMFSRQLAGLLKSGVPILQALETLSRQMNNTYFSKVIDRVTSGVRSGRSLSQCLADYPDIFSSLYVAMVHAGEESGRIRDMVLSLAQYQKQQSELMAKVKGALVYPVVMGLVGAGTVIFILTYVMPKIAVLFKDAGAALPWPTQVLLTVSEFMQSWWYAAIIAFLIAVLFFRSLSRTGRLKAWLSNRGLRIPGIRHFVMKVELERFCRTLAILLQSGIPIVQSIRIASATLDNDALRKEFERCHEQLTGGGSLGAALRQGELIPETVAQMISVGEESGSLDEALADLTDIYAQDIQETTKAATTLIEPLMILTVGLVVGFIVLAMLLPVFQMDVLAQ